jgi:type IV secretory pathway VirB3-like protein
MKNLNFGRILIQLGTVIVMSFARDYAIRGLAMTVAYLFTDHAGAVYLISSSLSHLVTGVLCVLPVFWNLRDSGSEKRAFLSHFSEKEMTEDALNAYVKQRPGRVLEAVVYAVTVLAVLFVGFMGVIASSPIILLEIAIAFFYMFGVYLFFETVFRKRIYKKWYDTRLHR